MAFGLEYTSPCPLLRKTAERGQAMTLGIVIYAGLTRTSIVSNESSCLGYLAYLALILALLIFKDEHVNDQESLSHCQELLDALNVGFVMECEDDSIIANKAAFDLLHLERGDVLGLQKLLSKQQAAPSLAMQRKWTSLNSKRDSKAATQNLHQNLPDGSLRVEYTSTPPTLTNPKIGLAGDQRGTKVFCLRMAVNDNAKEKSCAKPRSKLMVLMPFSNELRTSLNGILEM
jgi:hypothetical protein